MTALVMSEYLTSFGYRTTIARNGDEGVTKFLGDRPDIALVDVLLPKRDGFDVCFVMKTSAHGKQVPVVLMSAVYNNADATTYAQGLMAAGFLKKPFDLDVLVSQVHQLIGPP